MRINKSAIILYNSTKGKKGRRNEYLTNYKNKRYLDLSLDSVKSYDEVIILKNESQDEFEFIKSIYEGLSKIKNSKALVISCDMPLVGEKILNYMGNIDCDEEILIPFANSRPYFNCAIYDKKVIPYLKNMIEQKISNISRLFDKVNVRYIFPKEEVLFLNIKSLEEYLIAECKKFDLPR